MGHYLQNIMNKMAREASALKPFKTNRNPSEKLSEIEAFSILDDVLASLRKEYLSAKSHRHQLSDGLADEAMLSIAIDMEDSLWCAMQTRFLELRQDATLVRRVQKMIFQHHLKIEAYQKAKAEEKIEREKYHALESAKLYFRIMEAVREQNRVPKIFEWLILFLIFDVPITGAKKIEPFETRMAA